MSGEKILSVLLDVRGHEARQAMDGGGGVEGEKQVELKEEEEEAG